MRGCKGGRWENKRPICHRKEPWKKEKTPVEGLELILQPEDANVNNQVYESLMENYIRPIILRVRSERLRHI